MKFKISETNFKIVEQHLLDAHNILEEASITSDIQNASDRTEEALYWTKKAITKLFPEDSGTND
jgi:hypothetical protein